MDVCLTAQMIRELTPEQLQQMIQQHVPVAPGPAPAAPADDGDSTTAAPTDDDDSSSSSAAARCLTDDEPDEG